MRLNIEFNGTKLILFDYYRCALSYNSIYGSWQCFWKKIFGFLSKKTEFAGILGATFN